MERSQGLERRQNSDKRKAFAVRFQDSFTTWRSYVINYRVCNKLRYQSLSKAVLLGEVILNRGGTVDVPERVIEALSLKPKPGERSRLLWTPAGEEVIVTKGTPTSDWRKSMFRKNGTAAIPRHIQRALKLRVTSKNEERVLWIRKEGQIIVRKETRR